MMKLHIFLLLFVSAEIGACLSCFKKKKPAPSVVAVSKPSRKQQNALNDILFEGATLGLPKIVKLAIYLKADVHAIDSTDSQSAMYKAMFGVTRYYDPYNAPASNRYAEIINILKKAGAHQTEDIANFLHKEPIKSSFIEQLVTDGHPKEHAVRIVEYNVQQVAEFNALTTEEEKDAHKQFVHNSQEF